MNIYIHAYPEKKFDEIDVQGEMEYDKELSDVLTETYGGLNSNLIPMIGDHVRIGYNGPYNDYLFKVVDRVHFHTSKGDLIISLFMETESTDL